MNQPIINGEVAASSIDTALDPSTCRGVGLRNGVLGPVFCLMALFTCLGCGCASYKPGPASYRPYLERAITKSTGPITASVVVLNRDEAERTFGLPLHKRNIQPVWLRLQNASTNQYYFLPVGLDPDYHPSAEVAYMYRKALNPSRNRKIAEAMEHWEIPIALPATGSNEGFVFSNYDPGAKFVRIDVHGNGEHYVLEFSAPVPGRRLDYQRVDFETLYDSVDFPDLDLAAFREAVEDLPANTTDKRANGGGDPLNLVVVADEHNEFGRALLRNNWDVTEALTLGNALRLVRAFVVQSEWRTSPVSSLYVFGRPQDLAMQKARATIHQRNHLRLWLAPFTVEGRHVMVGQISRDIGLRFAFKAPGFWTHKIDPDTDEARDYLAQEMLLSGSVGRLAWMQGVGPRTRDDPGRNLTGDPWWTDGRRVILFLTAQQIEPAQVELMDWSSDTGN
jgi:hypothetical protein